MIRVSGLTKRYAGVPAVEDVSFEVKPGEIVGFLGPNGAGKSTVLKIVSTWLLPTEGAVEVCGHDAVREPLAVRRALGYLPEHNALYEDMVVERFLRFMARARGLDKRAAAERLAWAIAATHLEDVVRLRIHQCSKGYRQRIGLAASLIHDPRVILLDEPTHGLDPLQVVAFRDFLRGLSEGRSVLFSSHVLSEVAAICERILILNHGRLLADVRIAELEERAKESGKDLEAVVLDIVDSGGGREASLRGGRRQKVMESA